MGGGDTHALGGCSRRFGAYQGSSFLALLCHGPVHGLSSGRAWVACVHECLGGTELFFARKSGNLNALTQELDILRKLSPSDHNVSLRASYVKDGKLHLIVTPWAKTDLSQFIMNPEVLLGWATAESAQKSALIVGSSVATCMNRVTMAVNCVLLVMLRNTGLMFSSKWTGPQAASSSLPSQRCGCGVSSKHRFCRPGSTVHTPAPHAFVPCTPYSLPVSGLPCCIMCLLCKSRLHATQDWPGWVCRA